MHQGYIIQIFLITVGVLSLIVDVALLAKRKLSEPVSVTWGFGAIIMVLAGIILRPNLWGNFISTFALIIIFILIILAIIALFVGSIRMSELMRKNTEMAMNISLLNQEIVELKKDIAENHRKIEERLK